jgi:hypothetical protein
MKLITGDTTNWAPRQAISPRHLATQMHGLAITKRTAGRSAHDDKNKD